jgi:hypothetical protein
MGPQRDDATMIGLTYICVSTVVKDPAGNQLLANKA